jgi:hypothetical protein
MDQAAIDYVLAVRVSRVSSIIMTHAVDGRYFYVGQHKEFTYQGNESNLYLSINDDVVGNGSGAFKVTVTVSRNGTLCEYTGGSRQCPNYSWGP